MRLPIQLFVISWGQIRMKIEVKKNIITIQSVNSACQEFSLINQLLCLTLFKLFVVPEV